MFGIRKNIRESFLNKNREAAEIVVQKLQTLNETEKFFAGALVRTLVNIQLSKYPEHQDFLKLSRKERSKHLEFFSQTFNKHMEGNDPLYAVLGAGLVYYWVLSLVNEDFEFMNYLGEYLKNLSDKLNIPK